MSRYRSWNSSCRNLSAAAKGDALDDINHGTHVAGIAAAKNNSFGIVGVAPGAKVFSIKVFENKDPPGAQTEIICALEFIKNNADWIDVVNLSIYDGMKLRDYFDLVKDAVAKGVTFIGAAGNLGEDAKTIWPGADENIMTVGAVSDSDGDCGKRGTDIQIWTSSTKPPGVWIHNGTPKTDKLNKQ